MFDLYFVLCFFSTQTAHPSETNGSSISKLLPAKPPKPQPKPKPHVNDYAVTGPQAYELSEPNYHSIPPQPAEYETFVSTNTNPALYEPVYADTDASGEGTTAKTHVYHSVEPHGTSAQEQYYSDPTSPSQPPDLVPPTHMYEDPTLSTSQVCACKIVKAPFSVCGQQIESVAGEYKKKFHSLSILACQTSM